MLSWGLECPFFDLAPLTLPPLPPPPPKTTENQNKRTKIIRSGSSFILCLELPRTCVPAAAGGMCWISVLHFLARFSPLMYSYQWLANIQVKLCRTPNIKKPGDRGLCLCCLEIGDGALQTDIFLNLRDWNC